MVDLSMREHVLALIPQQPPFRFIDEIVALEEGNIRSRYRFRPDEYFYTGHFPGRPVTPGVILIEAMAQTGLVALGIYEMLSQGIPAERIRRMSLLFALADAVEFDETVLPGETVLIEGKILFSRRGTIRSKVRMWNERGTSVCRGVLTGRAVGEGDA